MQMIGKSFFLDRIFPEFPKDPILFSTRARDATVFRARAREKKNSPGERDFTLPVAMIFVGVEFKGRRI